MKKLVHGGDIYSYNDEKIIDFSANVNPLGLPQSVKDAIADNIELYTNYPDPLCRELKNAFLKYKGVKPENIVCGNGAADIIFKLVLAINPKKALLLAPTFSEYENALGICNCQVIHHFLLEENEFVLDDSIFNKITNDIDIMFICNPNNPTGIEIEKDFIIKIAEKCLENSVILVVDECFNEFLDDADRYSVVSNLDKYKNIIVLKAFTKIYAMAGIRLGYAFCSDEILIDKINNMLQPWSVSTVASKCGVAALGEKKYILKTKKLIFENREYLITELKKLGFKVYNSKVNYIFFKTNDLELVSKLEKFGLLIRSCSNYVGLCNGYYRIAVKNHSDNEILVECLQKIRSDNNG
jgi:histidinol-phosphate aminotransferase